MGNQFVIYVLIAIAIPSIIVFYYVGASPLFTVLKLLAVIILLGSVIFYFLLSSGKNALERMSVGFDDGLRMTSSLLKFMSLMNLIVVIISSLTTILTFWGYIPNPNDNSYFLTYTSVLVATLIFLIGVFAYFASFKILKFSKVGYFLALFISIPHMVVLLGIFPVFFLVAFRSFYFEAANVKTVDSYKKLSDLHL